MQTCFPRRMQVLGQRPGSESDLSVTENAVDMVLRALRVDLTKGEKVLNDEKSIARRIIAILQEKYVLTTVVRVSDFVTDNPSEISKAASHLAIATQRAAALFALQENLLRESTKELDLHIKTTKTHQEKQGFAGSQSYHLYFVAPLEKHLAELQKMLASMEAKKNRAQIRFQKLREDATRPIMEELQRGNWEYTNIFKQISDDDLTIFRDAIAQLHCRANLGSEIRQSFSLDAPKNSLQCLQSLYTSARESWQLLSRILSHVQKTCHRDGIHVRSEMGDLKSVERAMEKAVEEYDGDFSRLLDLSRGSIECKTIQDATCAIQAISGLLPKSSSALPSSLPVVEDKELRVTIVRVKNRLDPSFPAAAESGGYRDLLLNIQVNSGHICEVQLHIKDFLNVKKSGGHMTYTHARNLHLLDPELSHVRVNDFQDPESSGDDPANQELEVRPLLRHALERVVNGTCQSLHLNHVKFSVAECRALKQALSSPACNVREIALPNCGIDDERSSMICEGVAKLGDFRVVDLQGNEGITGSCVAAFISEELEKFCAQFCQMNREDSIYVTSGFARCKPKRVTDLNLMGNELGPEGAKCLAPALAHMTGMTSLALSATQVGPEGVYHLASALQRLTKITNLQFGDNKIGPEGAKHLAPALQNMPNMTSLYLFNNQLGADGARVLFPALHCMTQVRVLYLFNNNIGPEGARYLATALQHMPHMHTMDLPLNQFGPQGARWLAPALANLPELRELELMGNDITAEGVKHFLIAFANMPKIQFIGLSGNQLGSEGAKHFASSLHKMNSMRMLKLRSNGIDREGVLSLIPALQNLPELKHFHFQGNNLDALTKELLKTSLHDVGTVIV